VWHGRCSNPQPFSPNDKELAYNRLPGAARRRAVAKIHGLLRTGRNRKKPYRKLPAYREERRWGPLALAGGTALIIRRMIVPLTVAVITVNAGQAFAQGAFPAPLPGQEKFSRSLAAAPQSHDEPPEWKRQGPVRLLFLPRGSAKPGPSGRLTSQPRPAFPV
jgi:hypothetical protein